MIDFLQAILTSGEFWAGFTGATVTLSGIAWFWYRRTARRKK